MPCPSPFATPLHQSLHLVHSYSVYRLLFSISTAVTFLTIVLMTDQLQLETSHSRTHNWVSGSCKNCYSLQNCILCWQQAHKVEPIIRGHSQRCPTQPNYSGGHVPSVPLGSMSMPVSPESLQQRLVMTQSWRGSDKCLNFKWNNGCASYWDWGDDNP
jgi:hypothetical protein